MTDRLIKLAAGLALVAACAGCADASETSRTSGVPTIIGTPDALPPTWGTGPQAPDDPSAPKPTTVTWSPESRAAATAVAVKFMAAYARPGTPQPAWSDALAPYSSVELMTRFRQADTKYLTTSAPASTGTLQADDSNPYNGVVKIETGEGPWELDVHRQPDGSWRVSSLQPPVRQGH